MSSKNNAVKIAPWTIRNRMEWKAHLRKAAAWYEAFAQENSLQLDYVDEAVTGYARLCVRVSGLNGLVDFELSVLADTPEQQREKFTAYVNSGRVALVDSLERQMRAMDKADNELYAPEATLTGEA